MTTMNDMPESFGEARAHDEHEEKETAQVSAPASADGAGDVPAPEKKERRSKAKAKKAPTATKAARGKAAKTPGETKEKKPKAEKRTTFDISMLPPEKRERVGQRFERLHVLGRRTVENMLDMGEEFHGLAVDVEDPKDWEDRVKANADYDVKTARNWKAIHGKLGHRRSEILAHKVTPTVLIHLLPATSEQVDQVLGAFAAGQPMKVREVKDLFGGSKVAGDIEPTPQGGMKSLRALAAAKLARQQKSVATALKTIRQAFGTALEAKRLEKGKLAKELAPIAKLAHRELTEILCDIDPKSLVGGVALRHLKVENETWARLLGILYTLAVAEDWPDMGKLKAWLSDEVMPLLAFAIDGADVVIRTDEQAEVVAPEPAEVDAASGGDVAALEVMNEASIDAEEIAEVDEPTLPAVEPSAEAEADLTEIDEVKAVPATNLVVPKRTRRFDLRLERSRDVTVNALAVEMAETANRAGPGVMGLNGPA